MHMPSTSRLADEPKGIQTLVEEAKSLYKETFETSESVEGHGDLICTVAPGRVNLIGEHTDYTGGFVFPMAIGFSTVCVGRGSIVKGPKAECKVTSTYRAKGQSEVVAFEANQNMKPLKPDNADFWSNYVAGVVDQYMTEIKNKFGDDCSISFDLAINSDVPLGSGLSSSAAIEVAVATFIECILQKDSESGLDSVLGGKTHKAVLCQRAENVFCNSPCGIMDQYVSSVASSGSAILIDCRSLEYESVQMGEGGAHDESEKPVFVICNSNVKHSIGGGEYPIRVKQCAEATKSLQGICGDKIGSLRDATIAEVETARKKHKDGEALMDDLTYRRAKHVVTENERTLKAKEALVNSNWKEFGRLMNQSHESMKSDYEVSCEEIDILVDLAQNFDGVFGSRLTGGGFGGCTVTLVEPSRVEALCSYLKSEYSARTGGKECFCYETSPGPGAREVLLPQK